jgi:hypothetical protein
MKLELFTNASVVDDAIRFVSQKSRESLKPSSNSSNEDTKGSNEPEYHEDRELHAQ